jgi:hypothetical protein
MPSDPAIQVGQENTLGITERRKARSSQGVTRFPTKPRKWYDQTQRWYRSRRRRSGIYAPISVERLSKSMLSYSSKMR